MVNTDDVAAVLVRELDGFKREIELFPDDESVWRTMPPLTNSAGNLAMHVAGNLQHYIGAVLDASGYRRNRDLEFARKSGARAEILTEIERTAEIVKRVVPGLSPEVLAAEYPEAIMGMRFRTELFLLHLCSHTGFHLGQAGYLRRIVTGNSASSGPLPLRSLAL